MRYDDASLLFAQNKIKNFDANLGGTEIMEPMKIAYSLKKIEGFERKIFVITDGSVS